MSRRQDAALAISISYLAILAAACSPKEPTRTPNLVPSASPAVVSASPDPSASPGDPWGPLAVIPPQDGADTARTEGRLRITDACVFLDSPGGVVLLFWPSDRTTWRPEPPAITFANFDGSIVTVRDRDQVALGGSGHSAADSGVAGKDWVARMAWVARPSLSCSLDRWWVVGAVGR